MERKVSLINAVFFGLLIFQSLALLVLILYFSYINVYLNWFGSWPTVNNIINFLPRFLLLVTGLAFFILPTSLIFESKNNDWKKLTALASLLLLPWLDFIFNFLTNTNWEWPLAILKTAWLWFCGGILAYVLGLYTIKQVTLTWLSKLAITILFLLLGIYIYSQIWNNNIFNNKIEIISWHISLLFYTYPLLKNLIDSQKNPL